MIKEKVRNQLRNKKVFVYAFALISLIWILVGFLELERRSSSESPYFRLANGLCLNVPKGCQSGLAPNNKISFYCDNGSVGELEVFSSRSNSEFKSKVHFLRQVTPKGERHTYEFEYGKDRYLLNILLRNNSPEKLGYPSVCHN